MATESTTDLFRQRARAEAARYGSDPWVFVRELLQNARDAGARRVEIEVSRHGELERVSCRDDGSGMSYKHARRYLFALYASSKEDSREQAGKFGIGFWSVLRFEPSTITIRSRGARHSGGRGDAWQVSLDGGLGSVETGKADLDAGTEIVLERPACEDCDLAAEVMAATRHYGRFVTRRGDPDTPLPVTVDGRPAKAELKLEAPCATFRGKGFRGAVGLGSEPKVELFAQGLFVRSASSLHDLQAAGELSDEADATTEDVLGELPSMAPQVLIDSDELDLLLARSDARYDKHLRRILRTAEKQLGRLITRQLQALRPQPFYRLWLGALRDRLGPYLGWQLAAAGLAGLVLGLAVLWALPSGWRLPLGAGERPAVAGSGAVAPEARRATTDPARLPQEGEGRPPATGQLVLSPGGISGGAPAPAISGASRLAVHAYVDLADRYLGPRPGALAGDSSRLAMAYEPAGAIPFFAALVVDEPSAKRWAPSPASDDLRRYRGVACDDADCIEARLLVAEGQTTLRLPVPTGHRLDAASVRFDGMPGEVFETASGEALLRLPGGPRGVVEYRTGPAPAGATGTVPEPPIDVPAELVQVARNLSRLPVEDRVQHALDYVVERVVYDRSPAAWGHYRSATRSPSEVSDATPGEGPKVRLSGAGGKPGFVEIALDAGAGDCDVQSGVLVTLLRLAGVEARLALGYVGIEGIVAPGLHAWVEVRDRDGGWSVADPAVTTGDADGRPLLPASLAGARFPSREGAGWPLAPLVPVATAALLLGAAAWSLRRRSAGGIELFRLPASGGTNASEDLAALLGGALRHPDAFAGLPAMFHGRFVPLFGRRAGRPGGTEYISLARARRMGSRNRLFRSSIGSKLALRAAARGVPVIDASTAEGRVLSLALGAIDVDHWSSLLERSSRSGLSRRINARLDQLGTSFRLREASGLSEPWIEIALEDLRLGGRQIVVDPSHLEVAPVRALACDRPEAAAFTMLDVLLHRLELPGNERPRILAAFARWAVEEAARRAPRSDAGIEPSGSGAQR